MKKNILFFAVIIMAVFQFNFAFSQEGNGKHTFKIVGSTEQTSTRGKQIVGYDPDSPDHLFITNFNNEGMITSRRQSLFTGKKFDLSADYVQYVTRKQIIADGTTTFYSKIGVISKTLIFKEGKLLRQILYYPDGQQQLMTPGTDILDGEYKIWYQNGTLSLSGNYKNNLKNGNFEQFDQSGALTKKGEYQDGKLVSGEPVVPDIVYDNPEIPARFDLGEAAFDELLTKKATEIGGMKVLIGEKKIFVDILIDKTGKIIKLQNISSSYREESGSILAIFKDAPILTPATLENVPVQSLQKVSLLFSKEGIKMRILGKIYSPGSVDKIPVYPGGSIALRYYIYQSLRYPEKAIQLSIQGKVIVGFVIENNGSITDVKIVKGVHPMLDAEAIRVVSLMPNHIPGQLNGKAVRVAYSVPITFSLPGSPTQIN